MTISINDQDQILSLINMSFYPSTFTQISTPVLNILKEKFYKYQGTPFCFVQTSHRSKAYDNLNNLTIQAIQSYFNAEDYQVLLMPSGSAMASVYFNIMEPTTNIIFYEQGSFSYNYYKQMTKYVASTKLVNSFGDLKEIFEKRDKHIKNIYHYNAIDNGCNVKFPIFPQEVQNDTIIIKNINYCFPWIETKKLTEDIVYFQSQTGFSVPGFTVMLIKKSFLNKLQVRKDCPDMFDFILMVKMKSVVNTPFTLCTLILNENIRYANENKEKELKKIIECKQYHKNMLERAGFRLSVSEEIETEGSQNHEAFNFIKVYYNERQSQFIKQLSSYGWMDNNSQTFTVYIQSQNSKEYETKAQKIVNEEDEL